MRDERGKRRECTNVVYIQILNFYSYTLLRWPAPLTQTNHLPVGTTLIVQSRLTPRRMDSVPLQRNDASAAAHFDVNVERHAPLSTGRLVAALLVGAVAGMD